MRRLVVNTDGGSRGNPGVAGYGVVIADANTGEEILTRSVFIETATNNVAEYSALVDALMQVSELAKKWDEPIQVLLRADSKLVVEQMTGNWKIKDGSLQRLALAAQRAYPARLVAYKWVPRAQNKRADALANEAMDRGFNPDDPADAQKVRAAAEAAKAEAAKLEKLTETSQKALVDVQLGDNATQVSLDGELFANLDDISSVTSENETSGVQPFQKPSQETSKEDQNMSDNQGTDTFLVLVRHGATSYTESGLLCGGYDELDPPLSEAGLHQIEGAARLVSRFGDSAYKWMPRPQVLYSSPVQRAAQLGELLGKTLNLDVRMDERLREINVGEAAGKSMAELWAKHPDLPKRWASFESEIWPGLESMGSMCERLGSFARDIWSQHVGETVVVACHEIVTRIILGVELGWPASVIAHLEVPLASTAVLKRTPEGKVFLVAAGLEPELGR